MRQPRLPMVLADPARGGMGKMRVHLANEMARRGVSVDLLLARTDSPYLAGITDGVRVVTLKTSHPLFGLPPLVLYLRRERPDLMLTQRIRVNVAVLRARRLARVQTPVWTTLNTIQSAQRASLQPSQARRHLAQLRRWYSRNQKPSQEAHESARPVTAAGF